MRNSRQKQVIKTVIKGRYDHPTAALVCEEARQFDETISLATVYRNLNLLVESGEISKIHMPDGGDRFDYDPKPHAHFYCEKCKKLSNIKTRQSRLNLMRLEAMNGIKISQVQTIMLGICQECLKQENRRVGAAVK